jgi:hypothetical protein
MMLEIHAFERIARLRSGKSKDRLNKWLSPLVAARDARARWRTPAAD